MPDPESDDDSDEPDTDSRQPKPSDKPTSKSPTETDSPSPKPTVDADAGAGGSSNLDEFSQKALDAHNKVRALHGAPTLKYSDELASAASKWVDVCIWEHSKGKVGKDMGENLFATSRKGETDPGPGIQSW